MEITYFGSGICSYRRRRAGTILSVTVPATTTRSAWRGLAGKGMTPRRMTSYRGEPITAPISIAQHARPHWYIHKEYFRALFNRLVSGLGDHPRSIRPTAARPSATRTRGPGRG